MIAHFRRIVGFALIPAMSMLSAVLLLPLVSSHFGEDGWVALGFGQSVGALLSVVVGLAWPLIGGQWIATTARLRDRRHIYRVSLYSRGVMLVLCLAAGLVIVLAIRPAELTAALLFMAGSTLNGFTAFWYYAGIGTPRQLVVNEGVVRLAGYAASVVLLALGFPLLVYGLATLTSGVVSFFLNLWSICRRDLGSFRAELGEGVREIRTQLHGMFARIARAMFTYGAVTIVAVANPAVLATFTAIDQTQKALINAGGFWPDSFVAWVAAVRGDALRRRSNRIMWITTAVAIVGAAAWSVVGVPIVHVLFDGKAQVDAVQLTVIGITVGLFVVQQSFEFLALVPRGQSRFMFTAQLVTSLIGVAAIFVGAMWWGSLGALVAEGLVFAASVVVYLVRLARTRVPDASEPDFEGPGLGAGLRGRRRHRAERGSAASVGVR